MPAEPISTVDGTFPQRIAQGRGRRVTPVGSEKKGLACANPLILNGGPERIRTAVNGFAIRYDDMQPIEIYVCCIVLSHGCCTRSRGGKGLEVRLSKISDQASSRRSQLIRITFLVWKQMRVGGESQAD